MPDLLAPLPPPSDPEQAHSRKRRQERLCSDLSMPDQPLRRPEGSESDSLDQAGTEPEMGMVALSWETVAGSRIR